MPRGGGSRRSSRPTPSARAPPARSSSTQAAPPPAARAPPPAPMPAAPPPAVPQQSGGMLSGLGSTIMQGMAFGTGSAIAHRAVGAVAGSMSGGSDNQQQTQQPSPAAPAAVQSDNSACQVDLNAFNKCMRENGNSVTSCDFYFQALQQCQQSSNY